MNKQLIIYIIAGSNGAGKTTFACEYFPRYVGKVDFVNAEKKENMKMLLIKNYFSI